MPAIIRLRTAGETTSAIGGDRRAVGTSDRGGRNSLARFGGNLTAHCRLNVRSHGLRHKFDHGHHDGVAELTVRLRVGNLDPERAILAIEPHQARAFQRRQPSWPLAGLIDQHFGAVLVIAGRKRSGHVVRTEQTVAKAVARRAMLFLVVFQILPEMFGERVFRIDVFIWLQDALRTSDHCLGEGSFNAAKLKLVGSRKPTMNIR